MHEYESVNEAQFEPDIVLGSISSLIIQRSQQYILSSLIVFQLTRLLWPANEFHKI